ncbi:hypothetical protein [Fusobacterium necrophorum]|uniref:hypothetical protein n=1 Tax=Fusobacterium necrophorum TaxID=859 RepID=UPI00164EA270|nr:hypothetical protein [Fusobacterium necrophorum]
MALESVEKLPELIQKIGAGEYRIKVNKDMEIVIFSKQNRYDGEEIRKILKKEEQ